MKKNITKYETIIMYLFCLLISFIALLFTSKNSFLYQLNNWMDANAFFTVGKSMMNGVVPYKDIFEQKGLFLYFIYGIGYLISHKTFYGVFIIEVLFFSVFLFYVFKLVKMLLNKNYGYFIIPLIAILITTCKAFVHGGSAEEFCLTFFSIVLYEFFKYYKNNGLTNKEFLICGLCAGFVLMTKYTMLGFFMSFMLSIIVSNLYRKNIKNCIIYSTYFLLGMLIPFIISLIYLAYNGAINSFFEVYFYTNMTAYTKDTSNLFVTIMKGIFGLLISNGAILFLLIILLPYFVSKLKIKSENKVGLIVMLILTTFFIFYGLVFYSYYILPIFIFSIVSIISLFEILIKKIDKIKFKKVITIVFILLTPLLCYSLANYRSDIGKSESDFIQYEYAKIINEEKEPTLVNMGYLDMGLFTTSGIVPSTYFFEQQNFSYEKFPDNIDAFHEYIALEKTTFILFSTREDLDFIKSEYGRIFDNYELIRDDTQSVEGNTYNMFLFKVKGD